MAGVFYEVNATILDPKIADAWVSWILDEHIAEVVAAGAVHGRLVGVEGGRTQFSVQYEFANRAALETYLTEHAPRLRDEGVKRFPLTQVTYSRRIGQFLEV
ncbi:MAG: DUF4286 family protein [Phycisphaerales bacterium]|nr:DUF4286 family protein [Phycisphaerales bacterium]